MTTITFTTETETKNTINPKYKIIPLQGQVDENNLHLFNQTVEPLLESHHDYLVFDLAELDLMNSHAVGYLHNTHKKLKANNKQMAFVKANREILEILEHVGLIEIVPSFDSEEELVKAMHKGEI